MWLEGGAQLQMAVALDGERRGLPGGGCYEVFKQCLSRTLEASLASVC